MVDARLRRWLFLAGVVCSADGCTAASTSSGLEPHSPLSRAPAQETSADEQGHELVELAVDGYRDAVVSLPTGQHGRVPLVVAAHGAGGSARHDCEVWAEIVEDRAAILCPRGAPMGSGPATEEKGYFYPDHHVLGREVAAAVKALRERFGERVADAPDVYAGFSQGATMGALALAGKGAWFDRLILVEGGESEWDVPTAGGFRASGGRRVLLVCGRAKCREAAQQSVGWLRRGGVAARLEYVAGAGHSLDGAVASRVREVLGWVVDGDPR